MYGMLCSISLSFSLLFGGDGLAKSRIAFLELSGSKFSQLIEKRWLDLITWFVLVPSLRATETSGGESDVEEQLLTGMAATCFPNLEQMTTGTCGLKSR
jgi:hypothetical protein